MVDRRNFGVDGSKIVCGDAQKRACSKFERIMLHRYSIGHKDAQILVCLISDPIRRAIEVRTVGRKCVTRITYESWKERKNDPIYYQ